MKVLITGADGFIGKNLAVYLSEQQGMEVSKFTHKTELRLLKELISASDIIFHLAGVNRIKNSSEEFISGNIELTHHICETVSSLNRAIPVVYASSTQALLNNPYGTSKRAAENLLIKLSETTNSPVYILRLPNVFGKWARPNYNSVVATFCYNIANDFPIQVNDKNSIITLLYIDDLMEIFSDILHGKILKQPFIEISKQYKISVGALADEIYSFKKSRTSLVTEPVGTGLIRALYSTYLSYISPKGFSYPVPNHKDSRGSFVEMLKTKDSGQFSFFTAPPGVTRGGHYHHSKSEKFLVAKGKARFRFRHILTQESHEIFTCDKEPKIIESIPGWTHDITNVGTEEMVVMLWANEIFDRNNPDTYAQKLDAAM